MAWSAWIVFLAAALLEVGGDATMRRGLRDGRWIPLLAGACLLGLYGLVVNLVRWDFSKLLGVYVGVFALVSVLVGRYYWHETIPASTWIGLILIVAGGLVIQFGPTR